jgi:hypothetical protein
MRPGWARTAGDLKLINNKSKSIGLGRQKNSDIEVLQDKGDVYQRRER